MQSLYRFFRYGWVWGIGWIGFTQAFGAAPGQTTLLQPLGGYREASPDTARVLPIPDLEPRHRVELFEAFGKRPVLLVSYPWKEYARASMEVRFFSQTDVDDERIQPLFFRSQYFKGKMLQEVYECLLRAGDVPVSKICTYEGHDWRLLADRTILGRPAVGVVREIAADRRLGTESATAVVYPLLEQWAEDECHLCLELPVRYYPQPGQLRVWFLRENRVLWTEKLTWPGTKESSLPGKPAKALPPPPKQ